MVEYYKNENLDPAWVDEKAREAAESFSQGRNAIKSSQIRKFYGDVKTLERQWLAGGGDDLAFARIAPVFKLLKAKSFYAHERRVVPPEFRNWLWQHVDSVNDARGFKAFLLHFEAVVGFSYRA
ncbi:MULTISPECIES: type III-A CRISPR-associated protein Csm2 [unclassified Desulfovibrio]|uniref:type III-A CRISPR-associated protein Csm2 n=1 Tax=unclassified Desulfovibrio TaxID=2593640 RepID=UPI000F5F2570|nr:MULTISPECIES: type III-A CRISPR-associated protein Csm2 [unclassified Desulfovibrio]RRD69417.1 type III-A CRISPR-associated protein Csm2 [Desulfovibrio sp. OH1209_COT-279]RRD86113.1 type III-A CRISPR-associated protein Csm2 [Desulfovibrio sp. OH1186_COT-070]